MVQQRPQTSSDTRHAMMVPQSTTSKHRCSLMSRSTPCPSGYRKISFLLLLCIVVTMEKMCFIEILPVHAMEEVQATMETETEASDGSVSVEDDDEKDVKSDALERTMSPNDQQVFSKGLINHLFRLFLRSASGKSDQSNNHWWNSRYVVTPSPGTPRKHTATPYVPLKFFNVHRRFARLDPLSEHCKDFDENYESSEELVRMTEPTVDENCYPGMTLHVYQRVDSGDEADTNDSDENEADVESATTSDGTLASMTEEEDPPRAKSTVEILERSYTLLEPVQLELGVSPRHYLDFAYNPVIGREDHQTTTNFDSSHVENLDAEYSTEEGSTMPKTRTDRKHHHQSSHDHVRNNEDDDTALEEHAPSNVAITSPEDQYAAFSSTFASWWSWWFPYASTWWKPRGSTQSDFSIGKSPFAGGSHGEVWRGRRVCHKDHDTESTAFLSSHQKRYFYKRIANRDECDEQQPLVLKRLKINRGYRLLEAGLREVYFGNLLREQLDGSQQNLYTVYVDHFFREVPRRMFGRLQESKDLELWIVFEDAGSSLRSYMYTATMADGFIMYQHSTLWTQLRTMTIDKENSDSQRNETNATGDSRSRSIPHVGRKVLRVVLYEILSAAAILHQKGIVHRDIKPSNIMCCGDALSKNLFELDKMPKIECRLGDFSSGWDHYTAKHLYTKGPSPWEQTDEYAPPESYIGQNWVPFSNDKPQSYDSWSIGVTILELLLGTPNVFTVDQRTNALLTHKMELAGASEEDISHALYLAALSQFCIYVPIHNDSQPLSWPLRSGDPLHDTAMAKDSCTLQDFHRALRARDPLGIGFDSSADLLLHLIWQLLAWDPNERMTAEEALQHPYFTSPDETLESSDLIPGYHNALESQMLDPRMDFDVEDSIHEYVCPKCGRTFQDWSSCHQHANMRKHAKFCTYDHRNLPTCLNAHSMLPEHTTSGYCDLQGRRPTIEDFHSIHLHPDHQFYGIFDGHTGNLASKFAASTLYKELMDNLPTLLENGVPGELQSKNIERNVSHAFENLHERFLGAVDILATPLIQAGSGPSMDQSGTTATALLVTKEIVLIASLGDSRAAMSSQINGGGGEWKNFPPMSVIQLTHEHVASDPFERDLVVARGGFVSNKNGALPRVNGTLAITRSIGDAQLSSLLSREPHVLVMSRNKFQEKCGSGIMKDNLIPCFVILASDGLWDTMSNQEAVDMVVDVILNSSSNGSGSVFQDAAERLAVEAYVRGSTDNIGVCVVAVE